MERIVCIHERMVIEKLATKYSNSIFTIKRSIPNNKIELPSQCEKTFTKLKLHRPIESLTRNLQLKSLRMFHTFQ